MAHWNHRVMRRKTKSALDDSYDITYQIHEVHYDGDKVTGWTENEVAPLGEDLVELRQDLERQLAALDKPVLDYETGETVV